MPFCVFLLATSPTPTPSGLLGSFYRFPPPSNEGLVLLVCYVCVLLSPAAKTDQAVHSLVYFHPFITDVDFDGGVSVAISDNDDNDETLNDNSSDQRRLWMTSSNSWMSSNSLSTSTTTTTLLSSHESKSKSNENVMTSGTDCDVNSDLLSISFELIDQNVEKEEEDNRISPPNWVDEDLTFPNLVHDCTTWPIYEWRRPADIVNATVRLKQFESQYLPFEVPEVMAAKVRIKGVFFSDASSDQRGRRSRRGG